MQAWIADNFAEQESDAVTEGKTVIIHGTKAELKAIAKFLADVAQHLDGMAFCHMHLRDNMAGWSKDRHIDIEVTVDERIESQ